MDLAAIEQPMNPMKPYHSNLLIGESYQFRLEQLIQQLVTQNEKGISDSSALRSDFYELMQARGDPPLESIWVFSALSFQNRFAEKGELLDRVSTAKDLFQFLSACSASCNGLKSIALLAPLIFEVHAVAVDICEKDLSLKREKKVMREIVSLVEAILGFVNVCSCQDSDKKINASADDVDSLMNLARVWCNGRFNGNEKLEGSLKLLFPLVSGDVCARLGDEVDIGYLAGVVVVEAFLLRLCLKFRAGLPRSELQKEMRAWAVGSIGGFQSYQFFDILVRMLLEPKLPVTSLLFSEDELLLRKIIYDAVILVEYSFLKSERIAELPGEHAKSLAVTRLIVTHEAIEMLRENGDQTKALSYVNAFSSSSLPLQVTKCATSQLSKELRETKPNGLSPKALVKWLLDLENQGTKVFDASITKFRSKLVVNISKSDYSQSLHERGSKNDDSSLLFYLDSKGELKDGDEADKETIESTSAAFLAACLNMRKQSDSGKKRKACEKKKQVKFRKYSLHDASNIDRNESPLPENTDDSVSNGSDVENTESESDDAMEVNEH